MATNKLHEWHATLANERRIFADYAEDQDITEEARDFAREEVAQIEEELMLHWPDVIVHGDRAVIPPSYDEVQRVKKGKIRRRNPWRGWPVDSNGKLL